MSMENSRLKNESRTRPVERHSIPTAQSKKYPIATSSDFEENHKRLRAERLAREAGPKAKK